MKLLKYTKVTLLVFLLIFLALSYHPSFSTIESGGTSQSPILRFIPVLASVLIMLSLNISAIWKEPFIRNYILLLVAGALCGLLLLGLGFGTEYISEITNISMAIGFLIVGYNLNIKQGGIFLLIILFASAIAITSYSNIMTYIGAFTIEDQYLTRAKNTFSVMIVTAYTCVAYYLMSDYHITYPRLEKIIKPLLFILSLTFILFTVTMRARTGMLSLFIITIILIYKTKYISQKHISSILAAFIIIGFAIIARFDFNSIYDFIYSAFFQNREGDLTSGRSETYIQAWHIFANNPLWGRLGDNIEITWVHNYLLKNLADFGILGGLFIIWMYLYLCITVIIRIWNHKDNRFASLGFFSMLPLLFVSLAEPTLPYSPGTSIFLAFLCFGYSLRENMKRAYNNIPSQTIK